MTSFWRTGRWVIPFVGLIAGVFNILISLILFYVYSISYMKGFSDMGTTVFWLMMTVIVFCAGILIVYASLVILKFERWWYKMRWGDIEDED